ncbi:DUF4150 domain-containing protein [Massilia sp. W12]|uniref:DUF4150 domain-containing protein n=1 Tax=Massilia sp. W12 TaxID=3126507 RepID=UPI0030CE1689
MFATNSLAGMSIMTIPDICKTLVVIPVVPLPYPNITYTILHIPSVFNVMFGPGLGENLLTPGTISIGDQAGFLGGLISQIFMGPDMYIMGSFQVFVGGICGARMTSLVGMNGIPFNTIGMSLLPAQFRVILLS